MTEEEAYKVHIQYTFQALSARWPCRNNRPTYPTQWPSAGQ